MEIKNVIPTMVDKEQKKETDKKSEKDAAQNKNLSRLGASIEIDLSKEISEYSNGFLKAYEATNDGKNCFAIVCDPRYTPRFNMSGYYKEIANPTVPLLVANGCMTNPDGLPSAYCFVYENNLGKRLYKPDTIIAPSWKADAVLQKIAIPIINLLKDFHSRDLVHGNIRADNLYDGGQKNYEAVRLGDCLSLPASMAQPVIYETIERGMADPISRGKGTISDDLYALGALITMHMRSYDPLKGKTDTEILSAKVVNGSYSALVGSNDRFSGGILELLRGLLVDDPKQRWSLDEVVAWLDGRRLSPKQPAKKKKAARSITLNGIAYYYAPTLAHNLVKHPQEAVQLIENHELTHWVERTLGDDDMLQRLQSAIKGAADLGTGAGYWDRLLARVSIAIDPYAPIRFKNMSFSMDGLGNAFADSFVQKRGLSTFTSLFTEDILGFWITTCVNENMDISGYAGQIDKCRTFLKQTTIQYGIERCLYFLNDSVHCLSPLVENHYARTPEDFLFAVDNYLERNPNATTPRLIDKHAACFLISKDNRLIEPFTFDLSSPENFRHILATTQILAAIQKFHNGASAPHITQWLVKMMPPVIERFHNIERQAAIRKELNAVQNTGNVKDILDIIENPDRIRNDQLDFRRALKNYAALDIEKKQLEHKLKNPRYHAERSGREWAATVSGLVSALIMLGFIIVHFGGDATF